MTAAVVPPHPFDEDVWWDLACWALWQRFRNCVEECPKLKHPVDPEVARTGKTPGCERPDCYFGCHYDPVDPEFCDYWLDYALELERYYWAARAVRKGS